MRICISVYFAAALYIISMGYCGINILTSSCLHSATVKPKEVLHANIDISQTTAGKTEPRQAEKTHSQTYNNLVRPWLPTSLRSQLHKMPYFSFFNCILLHFYIPVTSLSRLYSWGGTVTRRPLQTLSQLLSWGKRVEFPIKQSEVHWRSGKSPQEANYGSHGLQDVCLFFNCSMPK